MQIRRVLLSVVVLATVALSLQACYVRARPSRVYVEESPPPVIVETAPPPVRVEVIPAPPSNQHFWIGGHWHWEGRWVWRPGHYEVRREGYRWVPPHYEARPNGTFYVAGHWAR